MRDGDGVKMRNGWAQGWVLHMVFVLINVMGRSLLGPYFIQPLMGTEQSCPTSPSWNIISSWLPGHQISAHWSFPYSIGLPNAGGLRGTVLSLFSILILPWEVTFNVLTLSIISMLIAPVLVSPPRSMCISLEVPLGSVTGTQTSFCQSKILDSSRPQLGFFFSFPISEKGTITHLVTKAKKLQQVYPSVSSICSIDKYSRNLPHLANSSAVTHHLLSLGRRNGIWTGVSASLLSPYTPSHCHRPSLWTLLKEWGLWNQRDMG